MIDVRRIPEEPSVRQNLKQIIRDVCAQVANQLLPSRADFRDRVAIYKLLRDLSKNGGSGLKPRSKEYIGKRIQNFIIIEDRGKLVACGEIIHLDEQTMELGAMGTHPDYQNQGLSSKIIEFAERLATEKGQDILLVTDNLGLIRTLWKRGYQELTTLPKYRKRHILSPSKRIYGKTIPTGQGSDPIISGGIVASTIREVMFREVRK